MFHDSKPRVRVVSVVKNEILSNIIFGSSRNKHLKGKGRFAVFPLNVQTFEVFG